MKKETKTMPSQTKLRDMFNYNPVTGILIWKPRKFDTLRANGWNTKYANKPVSCVNSSGYITVSINKKRYLAHRIIYKLINNDEPNIIDHINRDKTDNRISNLRSASTSLSMHNRKHKSGNLPQGVQPNGNFYMARINVNNKTIHLGTHKTPELAHEVYLLAKDMIYGVTPPASALPTY